jgi:probable HAF family extracellular repeat protein
LFSIVFNDLASGKTHGFLRTNNEYATIDFPGANVTAARGINREGDIVGFYVDASGKTHGFLRSKNELEEHERGDDE